MAEIEEVLEQVRAIDWTKWDSRFIGRFKWDYNPDLVAPAFEAAVAVKTKEELT